MNRYLLGGALLLSSTAAFAAKNEQPNILVFLSDDHGYEDSEPYGSGVIHTPNMQKMAESGLVFDRAYVASPSSGPSRAALLSGNGPCRNGAVMNHQDPPQETQTMVRELQAAGYEVVAIGKIASGKKHPTLCGFDYLDSQVFNDSIGKSVQKYLNSRTSDKPLCLMVGDHRPHVPWMKIDGYDPKTIEIPDYLIDTPKTREHMAGYYSDVTGMDNLLGNVIESYTKYLGNDDFLRLYSSDHGAQWAFGKWNLYERGVRTPLIVQWNGHIKPGKRTDAMVSWIDIMPTLIDIAGGEVSTDIDGRSFANVLSNPKAECRDAVFTTHTSDGSVNIYPIRAVCDKEFKYIRNLRPDCYHSNHSDIMRVEGAGSYWDEWDELAKTDAHAKDVISRYYARPAEELYDLKNDPFESKNLAQDPKYKIGRAHV